MSLQGVLLALHLLGVVVWVGGMAFALLILRPSLVVLEPVQRLDLHAQVFRRFFRLVWHTMPLVLLSGYAMLFGYFGGFAGANWGVHVMHLTGLVMAGIFVWIIIGPWKAFRAAGPTGDRAAPLAQIRRLIATNLLLGAVTIVVAAIGA